MYYSDLSGVLCSASAELDRASRGVNKDFEGTYRLADVVREVSQGLLSDSDDYSSLMALYRAFNPQAKPKTMDELYAGVVRNLKPLEEKLRGAEKLASNELKDLMHFCIRLNKTAMEQEVPVY